MNIIFYNRRKNNKDRCNGLIEQAWAFRTLSETTKILRDNKYSFFVFDL